VNGIGAPGLRFGTRRARDVVAMSSAQMTMGLWRPPDTFRASGAPA
jgi:hypothetical protein